MFGFVNSRKRSYATATEGTLTSDSLDITTGDVTVEKGNVVIQQGQLVTQGLMVGNTSATDVPGGGIQADVVAAGSTTKRLMTIKKNDGTIKNILTDNTSDDTVTLNADNVNLTNVNGLPYQPFQPTFDPHFSGMVTMANANVLGDCDSYAVNTHRITCTQLQLADLTVDPQSGGTTTYSLNANKVNVTTVNGDSSTGDLKTTSLETDVLGSNTQSYITLNSDVVTSHNLTVTGTLTAPSFHESAPAVFSTDSSFEKQPLTTNIVKTGTVRGTLGGSSNLILDGSVAGISTEDYSYLNDGNGVYVYGPNLIMGWDASLATPLRTPILAGTITCENLIYGNGSGNGAAAGNVVVTPFATTGTTTQYSVSDAISSLDAAVATLQTKSIAATDLPLNLQAGTTIGGGTPLTSISANVLTTSSSIAKTQLPTDLQSGTTIGGATPLTSVPANVLTTSSVLANTQLPTDLKSGTTIAGATPITSIPGNVLTTSSALSNTQLPMDLQAGTTIGGATPMTSIPANVLTTSSSIAKTQLPTDLQSGTTIGGVAPLSSLAGSQLTLNNTSLTNSNQVYFNNNHSTTYALQQMDQSGSNSLRLGRYNYADLEIDSQGKCTLAGSLVVSTTGCAAYSPLTVYGSATLPNNTTIGGATPLTSIPANVLTTSSSIAKTQLPTDLQSGTTIGGSTALTTSSSIVNTQLPLNLQSGTTIGGSTALTTSSSIANTQLPLNLQSGTTIGGAAPLTAIPSTLTLTTLTVTGTETENGTLNANNISGTGTVTLPTTTTIGGYLPMLSCVPRADSGWIAATFAVQTWTHNLNWFSGSITYASPPTAVIPILKGYICLNDAVVSSEIYDINGVTNGFGFAHTGPNTLIYTLGNGFTINMGSASNSNARSYGTSVAAKIRLLLY